MIHRIFEWAVKAIAHISADQWKGVTDYVLQAVGKATAGVDKRAWVLDKMNNLGIRGAVANFVVEAAVILLKQRNMIP